MITRRLLCNSIWHQKQQHKSKRSNRSYSKWEHVAVCILSMSQAPFSVVPLFIWPPPPPPPPRSFRSYIPSVWQNLLHLHTLRYTPFVWQTPPPPSYTPSIWQTPLNSVTSSIRQTPPPPPTKLGMTVWLNTSLRWGWRKQNVFLPMTSQFMVTHCHAKFGYKRYRFSPRHPSSWRCTVMPSLVTKGREIQNIYSGQSPHTWADERIVSNTPVPPTCTQMLMHAIEHRGCADTIRESALEVDSGRKIPSHSLSKTALNN